MGRRSDTPVNGTRICMTVHLKKNKKQSRKKKEVQAAGSTPHGMNEGTERSEGWSRNDYTEHYNCSEDDS